MKKGILVDKPTYPPSLLIFQTMRLKITSSPNLAAVLDFLYYPVYVTGVLYTSIDLYFHISNEIK